MSLERLKSARRKAVGTKQTTRAIERGEAKAVFLARDADPPIVNAVRRLAEEKHVPCFEADSMLALGRAAGIEVGAAAVAVLEE